MKLTVEMAITLIKSIVWKLKFTGFGMCEIATDNEVFIESVREHCPVLREALNKIISQKPFFQNMDAIARWMPFEIIRPNRTGYCYYGLQFNMENYYEGLEDGYITERPDRAPAVKALIESGFKLVISRKLLEDFSKNLKNYKDVVEELERFFANPELPVEEQ